LVNVGAVGGGWASAAVAWKASSGSIPAVCIFPFPLLQAVGNEEEFEQTASPHGAVTEVTEPLVVQKDSAT